MTFADLLRAEMDKSGHSQEHFAYLASVHQSTVSSWLTGRAEPRYSALVNLIRIYPRLIDGLKPERAYRPRPNAAKASA